MSAVHLTELLCTLPLKAFQLQILSYMMQTTDDLGMPFFIDCAVSSGLVLSIQNHIIHLVNAFIRAGSLRSAAAQMSVHCAYVSALNFLSNLLLLLVVHPMSRNSVQLSRIISIQLIINFSLESYLRC